MRRKGSNSGLREFTQLGRVGYAGLVLRLMRAVGLEPITQGLMDYICQRSSIQFSDFGGVMYTAAMLNQVHNLGQVVERERSRFTRASKRTDP